MTPSNGPSAAREMILTGDIVTGMVSQARGAHRGELVKVAAEYVQFAGWLHAETRHDPEAAHLLTDAEELADEADDGTLAAQVANFRGYLARQRGNARGVVRWFLAEHNTPGAQLDSWPCVRLCAWRNPFTRGSRRSILDPTIRSRTQRRSCNEIFVRDVPRKLPGARPFSENRIN